MSAPQHLSSGARATGVTESMWEEKLSRKEAEFAL